MAVTVTTAAERDQRSLRHAGVRPSIADLVLLVTSLASALTIGASYWGRTALADGTAAGAAPAIVNLNTLKDPAGLETVLGAALDDEREKRFVAGKLFAYVSQGDGGRRMLANVGALARAEVRIAEIDRAVRDAPLGQRARAAQARAAAAGQPRVDAIPLLTSAELAAIKPSLVVRDRATARNAVIAWTLIYLAAFLAVGLLWRVSGRKGDLILLSAAHLLTAVGFAAMLARPDLLRDTLLFQRYTLGVVAGLAAMAAVSFVNMRTAAFRNLSYVPLLAALLLCVLLILFGSGPSGSGAKVNLGPIQPVEAIRLLIAMFLAGYFARRWELLRTTRGAAIRGRLLPGWLNLPGLDYLLPLLFGVTAALGLFFIQRDLGPALVVAVVFLGMYAVARASAVMTAVGFLLLAAGFYVGYALRISATLAERVRMWQSPWDNAARGGDQVAQALWAFATGGVTGTGLGLGDTRYLPAGHTDLVLAAVGEEVGLVGLLVVGAGVAALVWRAARIAMRATSDYAFFLALSLTLFLLVPVLLMLSGTLGLVPLTGVVTPFLSYGGSAMLANFTALGLLAAIGADRHPPADLSCFGPAIRWIQITAGCVAVALMLVVVRVQVVQADEIVVRPHLGLQGDGSRRYQYNARVLDVARTIPRGTIFDRRGLPLASEEPAVLRRAAADYQHLGIAVDRICPRPDERCYPLGGRAFHLLGDVRTRARWTASNTSFIERDAEARLRGFEDHQTAVQTLNASGAQTWTLRRDYRALLPVIRHRHEPDHPAVRALLSQPREVRLTIDAALQLKVASIVSAYARRSSGRAAAVVIDPASGDLLASVSYPWPGDDRGEASPALEEGADDLFDRARYGLYPPGSTFKLITAAAALQRDLSAADTPFTCSRLPDGRVGARIPGWGRPVRDDVLDRHAHGTIDMHRALVVSCNAYFAQLAVRLGPEPLIATAKRADISLARSNTPARVRDALPQVGYGQGEVVATPLRMAQVAGAIATDGAVREVRWESGGRVSSQPFVSTEAARLLGRDMRDVVLSGTARSLRAHQIPIAGKTGTAEIAGAPSHSWFTGYAPYGQAARRIAVAVIIENAGYGGTAAAPAAGEIVSAAAQLGWVR